MVQLFDTIKESLSIMIPNKYKYKYLIIIIIFNNNIIVIITWCF